MRAKEIKTIQMVLRKSGFADVLMVNGKIINVFTNKIEEGKVVAIKGRHIFYVGEKNTELVGKDTFVFDAEGAYLVPGFIDAHTHLDSMIPYNEFVPYALKGGTTTVVTECAMVANACGYKGVLSFINATKDFPLKALFLAPPLVPPIKKFETAHPFSFSDFKKLLKRPDFVGIGEAYWNEALRNYDNYFKKVELAKLLKKSVEGHAAGAKAMNLFAYFNCGITSCHESISVKEALEKLSQGVYVMIRDGFIRSDMDELYKIKDYNIDIRRLILVSDVFNASMLLNGYLNLIVAKAERLGFNVIDAIKMVTINPADYFGLHDRGAIASGRLADINVVDKLEDMNIKTVFVDGKMVVDKGKYLPEMKEANYKASENLTLPKVKEEDLYFPSTRGRKVRVMEIFSPTIMKETVYPLKSYEGKIGADIEKDIIPVFLLDRRKGVKDMGRGFIKGTGIKNGAVATTLIWDTCNVLGIGTKEKDVAEAINRLVEIGGGWVVYKDGEIIFEYPMPVFGLIPLMSMENIAKMEGELEIALKKIGCSIKRAFLNLQTIAFTGLPFLRLTNKGLVDIKKMKKVALFLT